VQGANRSVCLGAHLHARACRLHMVNPTGGDVAITPEVNQSTRAHEMVNKDQLYRFEDNGSEEFDDDFVVPVIDMAQYLAGAPGAMSAFATELGDSLTDIGFAVLTGHGVDPALIAGAEAATAQIFDRPLAAKQAFAASRPPVCSVNQGYFTKGETSSLTADLVEGWVLTRRAFEGLEDRHGPRLQHALVPKECGGGVDALGRFLPADCASTEGVLTEYVRAMEQLPLPITRAMLRYLGCDATSIGQMDEHMHHPSCGLRLNFYPPISSDEDASGAGRLLGHEDVTFITLLPAPATEGLQILNRRTRKWIRVQAEPGTIILNTGDYMQRISADRFPSTTHRVSKPRAPAERLQPRVTVPLNIYLWEDATIEVLPHLFARGEGQDYEPINAQAFHTAITEKYYGNPGENSVPAQHQEKEPGNPRAGHSRL
jgi:isopenicillin N synthase-like dioxygenase